MLLIMSQNYLIGVLSGIQLQICIYVSVEMKSVDNVPVQIYFCI